MRTRSIFGVCLLSAVAIACALPHAASAQQQWTCVLGYPEKEWEESDCKNYVGPNSGLYGHLKISERTETEFHSTSKFSMKSVQAGVTLELQAASMSAVGEVENREEGAVTWYEGPLTDTYKEVTVVAPAGKGCKVKGGSVTTNKLTENSKGLTNQVKYTPASGETFAEFTIEGCSITALNHIYAVKGSVIGTTEGGIISFTHSATTEAGTLTVAGQKAGLSGAKTKTGSNGNTLAST